MAFWRVRPIVVAQPKRRLCWAAAIKAYTFATPGVPNTKMAEVIAIAEDWGCVKPDGTLINDDHTYRMLRSEFGLTNDAVKRQIERAMAAGDPDAVTEETPRDELSSDYFADKLRHSHVVFGYFLGRSPDGQGVWHTITVYGHDRSAYCYMDPLGRLDPLRGTPRSGDHHRCVPFTRSEVIEDYLAFWKA